MRYISGTGVLAGVTGLILIVSTVSAAPPTPPGQPKSGPGSNDYVHQAVIDTVHGKGVRQYRLFVPDKPKPKTAPVIVFNHGYGAVDPIGYGQWIEHLVKRGNIVIYPRYQAGLYTAKAELTPNAIGAVKDALALLAEGKHVKPDLDRFAIVGHSAGGIITANMAATWKTQGLPQPKAVMCVQPGISKLFKLADLKQIPKETLLLTVATEHDFVTGDADAKLIYTEASNVPKANKNCVLIRADSRGRPSLGASHLAPIAVPPDQTSWRHMAAQMFGRRKGGFKLGGMPAQNNNAKKDEKTTGTLKNRARLALQANAVDFYGFWKLFDGLCDAAFHSRNRHFALGNTPQQQFMGRWSDGTPVRKLVIIDP